MKLNHKDVWNGQYRGVSFEIQRWGECTPGDAYSFHWNYYLYIPLSLVKDATLRKQLIARRKKAKWGSYYDYFNIPVIDSIALHGGATYYEILQGSKSRILKIGCDYNHYGDEPEYETIDSVMADCQNSIDLLKDMGVLYNMCQGDGSLTEEKDGYYSPDKDRFYSAKYIDAMPEPQKTNRLKNLAPVTPKMVDLA